jgi:uncharacterized protein YuzE
MTPVERFQAEYDWDADAMYVLFQPNQIEKTVTRATQILVDYAEDGSIVGVEILGVRR